MSPRTTAADAVLAACGANAVLSGTVALTGAAAWWRSRPPAGRDLHELSLRYVASVDRDTMLRDRQRIQRAMREVARALDAELQLRSRTHASIRWSLHVPDAGHLLAGTGQLDVTCNFLLRSTLHPVLQTAGCDLPRLSEAEVAADVLARALDRRRAVDVFDAVAVLEAVDPADCDLRVALLVRLAGLRADWAELLRVPLAGSPLDRAADQHVLERANGLFVALRTLTPGEQAFLEAVSDRGEIHPELLAIDPGDVRHAAMVTSPALAWKADHVRRTIAAGDDGSIR